jgi:hypothetical protein
MKSTKKRIREFFRSSCLKRDKFKCVKCNEPSPSKEFIDHLLDVHHITDRKEMPGGGYVPENGITLCPDCHLKAEMFHQFGKPFPGYSQEDLYLAIGSSKALAVRRSYECLQVQGSD